MTELELELTYLVRQVPKDLEDFESKIITDVYYPVTVPHPNLRIRQKGDRYEITKKTPMPNDASQQTEETIPLTAQEFAGLTQNGGKRVSKRRYNYPYNGKMLEIDVFLGDLQGLVLADAEFTSRADQLAFTMPDFCLAEVTQEEFVAGGYLAGKSYNDIADRLSAYGYAQLQGSAA